MSPVHRFQGQVPRMLAIASEHMLQQSRSRVLPLGRAQADKIKACYRSAAEHD